MRRKLSGILFGLLFLVGFGILAYPTVSNQWNTYRQSRLISNYEQAVSDMQPEDYTKEWEAAREFDSTLVQNNIYGDVFGSDDVELKDTDYWKVLNVAGDGVMGYLSIPKINIKLAIYHGTAGGCFTDGDRSYEWHIPSHRRREYPQCTCRSQRSSGSQIIYGY